jgi:type IV secretion system protein VirD4
MGRGHFMRGMQGLMALHQNGIQSDHAKRARRDAHAMEAAMRVAVPSGRLGNGRLADAQDVADGDLHDPRGLFLGARDKRLLFFNGDGPLLSYLRTGGGKGRDLILPNLAHLRGRSVIVLDLKDGENAYASHKHRSALENEECIYLNPYGLHGLPNTRINPLSLLTAIIARGDEIDSEARDKAEILLPQPAKQSGDPWVRNGAVSMLALRMEYLAHFEPEECNLPNLWRFVNASADQLATSFAMMATCGKESIERRAGALEQTLTNAPKQFEAYKSDVSHALVAFEPGKKLADATMGHDFDVASLKTKPRTIYIILPADKIVTAAPWVSLNINYQIETIAKQPGPVRTTFLLDEFPQLPPAPAIMKALRLYRGKGIQLWIFSQGRFSMEDRWSREAVKEFEDQASVMTLKNVQEPDLLRDLQLWSGNKTVLMRGVSHNGGTVETAAANLGEAKRPVLQSEDILGLGASQQIIKVAALPRLIIADTVPFFEVRPWREQIGDVRILHRGAPA